MRDILEAIAPVRAEQIRRWQDGDRVRLETLLASRAGLADDTEALLDLIYAEVLLREEHGEAPTLREYVGRFPHLEVALRRQFGLHEALQSLEVNEAPSTQIDTERVTRPRRADDRPERLGQYDILEEIGRGGMGIVYKARHTLTGRLAALKVIRAGDVTAEERARFLLEAKAVATLSHPHIVQIHEVCAPPTGEGTPFVALEYVDGGSLAARINGTPLPPHEAAALLKPLAEAMAHAHAAGIIHRDLKPANVLIADCGLRIADSQKQSAIRNPQSAMVKITDFGLAKQLDADSGQTRTGAVMGTPSYMAPEQASGQTERIGPRSDVYALGAILYEMLTGRPPFKGTGVLETLDQVRHREPVAPRQLNPAAPRDLETICLKCLQKEPGRRYSSSQELADDVGRYLNGEPIRARPVGGLERVWKWMKRRPTTAALLGVSIVAATVLVMVWVSFTLRLEEQTRRAEAQKEEAQKQERIARRESELARQQAERAAHLLQVAANAVDEIAVAARGGKMEELETRNPGSVLFKLAGFYAKASATFAADRTLQREDRQRLAEQYAVSAVRLLHCAKAVDFFHPSRSKNRVALDTDADLAVLRDRADYQRFRALIP